MQRSQLRWQGCGWAFVELFALSSVAVTQPYLDVVSKNSELLVTHDTTWSSALLLATVVALVPAVAGTVLELAVHALRPRAVVLVHGLLCGALVGVLTIEVAKPHTTLGPHVLIGLAIFLGAVGALLIVISSLLRRFLHWLALGALAFVPLFLFSSPATTVLDKPAARATVVSRARSPHRVVMVVLDELPTMSLLDGTGHVDPQLFPNLARFSADAVWYRNHAATAGFTQSSVPAILTGRYPNPVALPTIENYPRNLFTLLGAGGSVNVHEAITRLCPKQLCAGSTHGFPSLLADTTDLWSQFASPNRFVRRFVDTDLARSSVDSGLSFVRSLHRTHGLHLDFVHLEIPHYPWERLPDLRRYSVPASPSGESYSVTPSATGAATARARHLMQLQAADTLVGRIISRLRTIGQYDDSMVVVTADHGVAFTPGQYVRIASPVTYPQIVWAPLMIKYPGNVGHGVIDDRAAQSIDVVPTIADVVGLRIPWSVVGTSLRAAPVVRPTRRFYSFYWADLATSDREKRYVDVGTAAEFRIVLGSRSAPAGGDPTLRTYRIGPYGGLVGRSVAPLRVGPPSDTVASISDPSRLHHITLRADPLDWVWNQASLTHASPGGWYSIESGTTVIALAQAVPTGVDNGSITFLIPPQLVRAGRLHLRVHLVSGSPSAPVLTPVAVAPD